MDAAAQERMQTAALLRVAAQLLDDGDARLTMPAELAAKVRQLSGITDDASSSSSSSSSADQLPLPLPLPLPEHAGLLRMAAMWLDAGETGLGVPGAYLCLVRQALQLDEEDDEGAEGSTGDGTDEEATMLAFFHAAWG